MTADLDPHWWSWADIVRHADQLGIPNFQRGAVWDASNCVALLESIYEQSPCGSFVLWAPTADAGDPRRHGAALRAFAADKEPIWLVDGQQRTRAMFDIFQQLTDSPSRPGAWALVRKEDLDQLRDNNLCEAGSLDDEHEEEDGEDGFHPWLVVLPAMSVFDRGPEPYFGRHSESRNVRRGSMFRRLRPQARTRRNAKGKIQTAPPLPVGVVPLAALVSPAGVFHHQCLRDSVCEAMRAFDTDTTALAVLDELLPWGPQFVTGHAYEAPRHDDTPATPMCWADLHARRQESSVREMIERLAGLFSDVWRAVFDRFQQMLIGPRFAVGWLPPGDVSAAIDAYVRINRAGIRVRAEERALALLSRARPELLDDLADFYRERDRGIPVEDPRALLVHESDRQMGFSLWMTIVTRYTALALLGDSARRWLGVSAIDKDTFSYRLDRVGPTETDTGKSTWAQPDYASPGDLLEGCTQRSSLALLLIDSVLSQELHFDHRMARPPSRALYPVIDMLYRIPATHLERLGKDQSFRQAITRLLHWTLLAPAMDQPDLEQLIVQAHGIDEESARNASAPIRPWDTDDVSFETEVRKAIGRYQASLLKLWRRNLTSAADRLGGTPPVVDDVPVSQALTRLAGDAFGSEIRGARSLQHPAVGWLYALERRGRAQEFLWTAQFEAYRGTGGKMGAPEPAGDSRTEEKLCRSEGDDADNLYPEKQHIVPFSIARQIAGKSGTRATASPANAIGNLTWLSRRQNGLDALADRWTVMDRERDSANLVARGMLAANTAQGDGRDVLSIYEALRAMVLDGTWQTEPLKTQDLFDDFCRRRLEWINGQMRAWLEEPLPEDAGRWLVA